MASGERPTDDKCPQDEDMNYEKSSLYLVIDGKELSESYYQKHFRKEDTEFKPEIAGISKPANESSKDVIVEVETRKEEVDMTDELKSKASRMISDTTTITLSGPFLPEIVKIISLFMENDPFLMGRGLHVDDSMTKVTTEMNNKAVELEQGSVKVNGPFRLVKYLRERIHQTLVKYIAIKDSPQGESIFEIAKTMAEESDGLDGGSDQSTRNGIESKSSAKWEGERFYHSANTDRHKSDIGTSVDDPPHGTSVAVQTDTTTQETAVATGNQGFKGNASENFNEGNVSRGFHPNASTDHQNSNVRTSVDDTSVAAQTDTTTPKATVLTGKESSEGAVSEATSEEPDVVEIPLEKSHRRLVVKKGRFFYEDADIKIVAICSEMGFTKGLNKNLNDQLKGQPQQTVVRRYQNGRPDKFDVFTIHCPPSTIGCRYLVVANILDHNLASHQDHHKFLQQILHSVFKEADTLEMPTVAIATQSFANWGFPEDTILPSFVRTLNQYQFTNDEFFSDVRVLATSAENFSHSIAVAERFLGRSLTSRHTSSKKTTSDMPNSEHDNVHLSSQGMIDKNKQRVVQKLADTSKLDPAVVELMDRCQMIDKQSLRIHSDLTRVDALEGAEQKLEEFSTSYQDMFKRGRIIRESLRLRESLPHNTLAMLVSTLDAQFTHTLFNFTVDNNILHFLSLDQSVCSAVEKAIQDFLSKRKGTQRQPPHTEGKPEQPTITLQMPYNRSLTVKKGDLVKEEVMAIVNAANGWLKHGAGVAYAINHASRGQVQKESDRVIRDNRQRPIPTGQVAVTGAGGDLRCKAVIHAVGPDASVMKVDDCKQLLKQACENTLHCAENEGMHSIALPPISSGIYAMPKDLVAQILIDTILQYPYRQDSTLKDIRIVIIDQLTVMPFLQYAQQSADNSPFLSPTASTTSPSSALVPSTSQQPSFPPPPSEPDALDIPLEKTHRKLVLKKGRFLYEDANIKIAAICSELQFSRGLNKDLNDQLKGQLQQTVDRRYQNGKPDKFDVFTVHCPPSTIGCRYLVVANILDRTLGSRQDHHKFLQQILHSVFKEADTLEMPSVAIVPTTFAIGGFPKNIILPSFIRMFSQYQFTNDEFLTDVRFLSATDDDFTHLIASAKRTMEKTPSQLSSVTLAKGQAQELSTANQGSWPWSLVTTVTNTVASTVKSLNPFSTGTDPMQDESMKGDTVIAFGNNNMRSLVIKLDNLIDQDVTAIVNPANCHLKHFAGVAAAIDKASNGNVQRESAYLIQRMGGPLATGRVAITKAGGSLRCEHVIHAVGPDAQAVPMDKCQELLKQVCKNILQCAEQHDMKSIALPAISTGFNAMPTDLVAQILIDTILRYSYKPDSCLKEIYIVINDREKIDAFLKCAHQIETSRTTMSATNRTDPASFTVNHPQPSFTEESSPSPKSEVIEIMEIPLEKIQRKLVVKKGHFLYEDADIKIAAICSEMVFTEGLNKNLNDQLKGQLQQTVDRRYQKGKPDKFDVFTVHCPPSTIGCRYLVVANILDHTLGKQRDHHKFLQQILHSVFKEADTLEMPSVAIVPTTFTIGGFPKDSILPSFIRMFSQYQFTNDEFLTDVRFLSESEEDYFNLCAAASRLVTVHTSTKSKPKPNISLSTNSRNKVQGNASNAGRTPPVAVVTGDIVQFGADVIIVPVNMSLDMKGATSKAVNDASGGDVLKKVTHLKRHLVEGKVYPVKCEVNWNIQAEWLYLLCRSRTTKMDTLKRACRLALDTAKNHGLESIAFPPITTHKGKDELAKSMMEVFDTFQERNHSDLSVTVVIKKDDDSLHKAFMKILECSMPPLEEDGQSSEVLCTEI